MNNGGDQVAPPSNDLTITYWFSSGVSKFSKSTYTAPFVGWTSGCEPWLSLQPAAPPTQNAALPLMTCAGDHDRARSSEWLSKILEPTLSNRVHVM